VWCFLSDFLSALAASGTGTVGLDLNEANFGTLALGSDILTNPDPILTITSLPESDLSQIRVVEGDVRRNHDDRIVFEVLPNGT
jgi:hypothetical protein